MHHTLRPFALILVAATAASGCGGSAKSTKKDQAGGGTGTATGGTKTADGGVEFTALEFGPYLAEAPKDFGSKQVSVEFGFFDVREQMDGDKEDIFDYRFKQAAVYVQGGQLPAAAASGCQAVQKLAGVENPAKSVAFSGGASGEKTFAKGVVRLEGKDDDTTVDPLEALIATIKGLGTSDIEVTSPVMPTAAAIQFAGAIDTNVTVNTMVADLNDTLGQASDDLLIGDVGTAKNYNLVVVTLYPGADAAEQTPWRCYVAPNGSATLAHAKYAKLLPLRGIVGHFANIEVKTTGDVTTWAASIAGQGAEDLTVK